MPAVPAAMSYRAGSTMISRNGTIANGRTPMPAPRLRGGRGECLLSTHGHL